jgi:hypothetical protein
LSRHLTHREKGGWPPRYYPETHDYEDEEEEEEEDDDDEDEDEDEEEAQIPYSYGSIDTTNGTRNLSYTPTPSYSMIDYTTTYNHPYSTSYQQSYQAHQASSHYTYNTSTAHQAYHQTPRSVPPWPSTQTPTISVMPSGDDEFSNYHTAEYPIQDPKNLFYVKSEYPMEDGAHSPVSVRSNSADSPG